ncbi:MAG TPA: hydroxymethylglutaryl-CoA lyase [Hyphomicrobiaceae bacterium]|nr:hydroxymethylglutaryl-CoA lyase [Hyphomicrobiaceae bacterium]
MSRLPKHVTIVEVGTRDGFQIEKKFVPTDVKVEIINGLLAAGVQQMQVTSFVSPKAVPALADAEEVFRRINRPKGVTLTALVANMKGAERAIAAKVDVLDLVVSASETHNRKNVNRSVDESLQGFTEIAKVAAAAGVAIKGGIATALGCPFEGDVPTAQIVRIARHYRDLGAKFVSLGDTTGMATPPIVRKAVRALKAEVPEVEVVLHLHNTRGLGLVNAMAGLEEGVSKLDGAIAGLGGCPFAAGATGNVCTEDLVFMLHECGIDTGIDLRKLIAVAKRVQDVFGRELPGQVMKSGLRLDLHDTKAVPTAAG